MDTQPSQQNQNFADGLSPKKSNRKIIVIVIIAIVIIGVGIWYLLSLMTPIGPWTHAPDEYLYTNKADCAIEFTCDAGYNRFFDKIGCGCEKIQDPTASSPDTASATAGWQTYRNEEYGFEIKYPNTYSISNTRSTYIAKSLESFYAYIDFSDVTDLIGQSSGKNIIINDAPAVELPIGGNRDGGIGYQVRFTKNNKILDILFSTNQKGYESKLDEFKQILSTFKFTR